MLKYVINDNIKEIAGGSMKKIVTVCLLTFILTGCHKVVMLEQQAESVVHNDQPTKQKKIDKKQSENTQHKIVANKVKHIKAEISKEVAVKSSNIKPVTSKREYVNTVKEYSKAMDQVINTMPLNAQEKEIEQQLKTVKHIVVKYESKTRAAKDMPQIKVIDSEVKKANEKYIESLGKIASAIKVSDPALMEAGYTDFSKGHTHLNRAYYQVQSMEEAPEQSTPTISESTEAPSLEIVVYKAGSSEEVPVKEPANNTTNSK